MVTPSNFGLIRFGDFELNVSTQELRERGVLRNLAPQPLRLLVFFTETADRVVSRAEIHRCLWGERKYIDANRGINFCINQIRVALRDTAEHSRYIRTLPRQGYRFVAPIEKLPLLLPAPEATSPSTHRSALPEVVPLSVPPLPVATSLPLVTSMPPATSLPLATALPFVAPLPGETPRAQNPPTRRPSTQHPPTRRPPPRHQPIATLLACLLLLLIPNSRRLVSPVSASAPTAIRALVLGDFRNLTGDAVFDDILRQALVIGLGQSPYLELLPEGRIRYTLKLMGRPDDEPLTPTLGREVCQRAGSTALLNGRISRLGQHYLVGVTATACSSGDAIVQLQAEAARQEDVLSVLRRSAAQLRTELGESLPSLQRFDAPIETTTTSMEALRNLTLAVRLSAARGDAASIPPLQRAIELDPQFSLAYALLAAHYSNLGQSKRAVENATKAYESREHNTEYDRLFITALYFRTRGELERLTQTLESWRAQYPNDARPWGMLGANYVLMGQYEQALAHWRQALSLRPDMVSMYENLGLVYLALGRGDEARDMVAAAKANHLSGGGLNLLAYMIAFRLHDAQEMKAQAQQSVGAPATEDALLAAQANTEAFFGRLDNARKLTLRAVASALRADAKESAGVWQASGALREATFGYRKAAIAAAESALRIDDGRNVKVFAALSLALAGATARAEALLADLERDERVNTTLELNRLPSIRAAIALARGQPAVALKALEIARPYELGLPTPMGQAPLYPAYLRGEAYLALHQPAAAAVEFKTVLDHPGITLNTPLAALSYLKAAHAFAQAGEFAKAQAAQRELAVLWRGADAHLPRLTALTPSCCRSSLY